jgi:hypothetical protein
VLVALCRAAARGAVRVRAGAGVARAEAYLLRADRESARLDLAAACSAFERLGARPDAARAAARLAEL